MSTRWNFPPSKILVVDDGVDNRELLVSVLAEQGLSYEEAEDGQQAIDLIESGGFDLVLMDMHMRVLDGFAATRIMRERGVTVPIVALTADAMADFEEQILKTGCTAYLSKPFDIDVLIAKLAELLGGTCGEKMDEPPNRAYPSLEQSNAHDDTVSLGTAELALQNMPLKSRWAGNTRLAPIVRKFAARFDEMLAPASLAAENGDCAEVVRFAHWLAGAAGNMGYDTFTPLARELEQFALRGETTELNSLMVQLRQMSNRIELPADGSATRST